MGESQPRARRGDANVAGERDLQALVDGVPVEDGDHRLADGGDGIGGAQITHGARPIGPEAEGVAAPGEQYDAHVGVDIDALAGLPELRRHQLVHRVAGRRTVQRDGRHVLLDSQRHGTEHAVYRALIECTP